MRPPEVFIQQPIRSLQTMLQVIALDDNRIPLVIPDGIYGQTTMNAISLFQQLYSLPITGVSDQRTWDKIVEVYEKAIVNVDKAEPIEIIINRNSVLSMGSSGAYVYFLQVMLLQLAKDHPSISEPNVSGYYDSSTKNAVSDFQRFADLSETGIVDKLTWKNLVQQFTLNLHHSEANDTRSKI